MSKLCSLIIRTKNEERWIGSCLSAVFEQTYKNFEVILVDNQSIDRTLEKSSRYPLKEIVNISDFRPGAALNSGIKVSSGEYIVCLSGHCIPVNEYWLEELVKTLESDELFAGVYGRQEPMAFSKPADKRDLMLVFGLDKRIQQQDSFFHNANSIIRRELWEKVPFDDDLTNIEDRVWAQEMLKGGYKLAYEPLASVYHYHGIHHNGNEDRCRNVVRIIEDLQSSEPAKVTLDVRKLSIVALIPVRGADKMIGDKPQLSYTIDSAKSSSYIDRVFVITDNQNTAEAAISLGAECPFIRPEHLSRDYTGIEAVMQDAIVRMEAAGIYADLVVYLEETFPFRAHGLIDKIIDHTLEGGYDSVLAAHYESGSYWREDENGSFLRVDSGDIPRDYKEKSFIGLKGLCCVTHPEYLRNTSLLGSKVGIYPVDYPFATFEVRNDADRVIAKSLSELFVF